MIAPLVVFVAIAWVAVLVAAPLLPAVPAAFLYVLGSRICHQIAARSFHVDGTQLPVCARCTGIYAGLALGALYAIFATSIHRGQTPRGLTPGSDPITSGHWGQTPARWVVVVGALPTLVTVLAEWTGVWQTSNVVRALAGAPLGIAVGVVVIAALTARPGLHLRRMRSTTAGRPGSASLTYLICAAAWAIPGGGHLWLGRREKGLIFLITLPLMFVAGLWLEGRLFPFELGQPLVALAAFADLGIGIPYVIAKALGAGQGRVVAMSYEYGNAFLIVTGLLNMLVVLDAFDIAQGRK